MREELQSAALKQIAIMNRQLAVLQEQLELTEQLVILSGQPELPVIESPAASDPQSAESPNDLCALCGHERQVHKSGGLCFEKLVNRFCGCQKFTPANKAGKPEEGKS